MQLLPWGLGSLLPQHAGAASAGLHRNPQLPSDQWQGLEY